MDSQSVILSVLGIIVGAIISNLITKHYYKKSIMFEKDMRNLTASLEKIYMDSKYPSVFDTIGSFFQDFNDQAPENKDIPHLSEVCCESNIISRGREIVVLFRMVDLGRNFPSSGIEVRNKLNNYNLPIRSEGFGWFSCRLSIPLDAPIGNHVIAFTFIDRIGNKNDQEFTYTIN